MLAKNVQISPGMRNCFLSWRKIAKRKVILLLQFTFISLLRPNLKSILYNRLMILQKKVLFFLTFNVPVPHLNVLIIATGLGWHFCLVFLALASHRGQ